MKRGFGMPVMTLILCFSLFMVFFFSAILIEGHSKSDQTIDYKKVQKSPDSIIVSDHTITKEEAESKIAPEIQAKYELDPERTSVEAIGEDGQVSGLIIKGSKRVRFFGVIPVYMPVQIVASLQDSSQRVEEPWWSHFTSS